MPRSSLARVKADPIAFIQAVLRDPETGRPFVLYPAEERFLREAFTPTKGGRLPFPELVYAAPKKSGKTTLAALATLYVTCSGIGGMFPESYVLANDYEQAQSRVFTMIGRIIEASPALRDAAMVKSDKITFPSTGATIRPMASEFAGAAGTAPSIVCLDELWGFVSERSRRLFDEMLPTPTRKVSVRLVTTYAGFEGESELLESLYKRGLKGEEIAPSLYQQPGMLMFWSHNPVAPWQTEEWLQQMRGQLRPNAFLRMIENRFVSNESSFVDADWWDACEDAGMGPLVKAPELPVFVGVDASTKRDSTAVVACAWDRERGKVRLVWHRVWQPSPSEPLDFEATVERTLLDLRERFHVQQVSFDPYQLVSVAQRLAGRGLPMVEFPQSVPNLTEASSNLYELVKGGNLLAYRDDALRKAVMQAVAIETPRGWRIAKEKASHRIDVVVALAQAALVAVKGQTAGLGQVEGSNLSVRRTAVAIDPDNPAEPYWPGVGDFMGELDYMAREDLGDDLRTRLRRNLAE